MKSRRGKDAAASWGGCKGSGSFPAPKAAAEFVTRLCKCPGEPRVIADAQNHIVEAHAERLTIYHKRRASGGSLAAEPTRVVN